MIESLSEFSPQALGELKAWLEPWFGAGGGGTGGGASGFALSSITKGTSTAIPTGAYTAIGFGASYDFNTNTTAFRSRSGTGSGVFVDTAGYYQWIGWADLDPAGGGGNQRIVTLSNNGSLVSHGSTREAPFADENDMLAVAIYYMPASTYTELVIYHDAGADLTVNAATLQGVLLRAA